ncbi:MAG TPA: FG-GAP-like repeat-containing protein [Pseudomonadota bacterium]|nr:FG-GAP-like repeat-containing protein [Pseudomonadota bacterium]
MLLRTLALGSFCLACQLGCQDLWSFTLQQNPNNCASLAGRCGPDSVCNSLTEICEPGLGLSSLTPPRGPTSGGTQLSISGRGFLPGTQLRMGQPGALVQPLEIASEQRLEFKLPAAPGACGRVPIEVSRPGVESVRRDDLFSYFLSDLRFNGGQPVGTSTSNFTTYLAAQDLNGDGLADVVATAYGHAGIDVYLGSADGSLQSLPRIPTGAGPYHLAIADVDGNGIPDIAVANSGGSTASVLLGTGGGKFQSAVNLANSGAFTVHFFDADSDSRLDLVVLTTSGKVRLWKGDGKGGFAFISENDIDIDSVLALSADFDHDGRTDLVGSSKTGTALVLYRNRGDGTFQLVSSNQTAASATNCIAVDVNQDGKLDLIAAEYYAGQTSVFLGHGDGTFEPRRAYNTLPGNRVLASADFNCDGVPDIAVSRLGATQVLQLLGRGDGTFDIAPRLITLAAGTSALAVVAADVDHDGRPDLVVGVDGTTPAVYSVLNTSQ